MALRRGGQIAGFQGRERGFECPEGLLARAAEGEDGFRATAGLSQLGGNDAEPHHVDRPQCAAGRARLRRPGRFEKVACQAARDRRVQPALGSRLEDPPGILLPHQDAARRSSGGVARRLDCHLECAQRTRRRPCRTASGSDALLLLRRVGQCRIGRAQREERAAQGDAEEANRTGHGWRWTGMRGKARGGAYHDPMIEVGSLRRLPKAELHQHLDGALRPATAVDLAREIGLPLTLEAARQRLVAPVRCRDQAQLLEYFELPISLLQTVAALRRAAAELVEQMALDGITYGEIRWAPRLHLRAGLSVEDVIGAVAEGTRPGQGDGGPLVALIVTAMRQHAPEENLELARIAAAFGAPVAGFDLAGPEAAFPASPHEPAFRAAERGGLSLTAHAGEVPGSQRTREVLALGVRRIAHGVTVAAHPELLEEVRARDVTLDLCPTSNVQTGIVEALEHHPFANLHRAGVSITISTDDRTVAGTTLTEELERCLLTGHLDGRELAAIALNAFQRAFAPRDLVSPLQEEARAAWTEWAGRVSA